MFTQNNVRPGQPLTRNSQLPFGRVIPFRLLIGLLFVVAVLAFEVFNFDTTKYALTSFLGDVSFLGIGWAAILAIAFCAIDFAGLLRLFIPDEAQDGRLSTPKEVWYLMGAWLLGATLNAIMTWWAVSLTLLNHDIGNEVLSRDQLLNIVPIFVASLVWLTRILFIGSLSVASSYLADGNVVETAPARPVPYRAPQSVPLHAPLRAPDNERVPQPFQPVTDQVPAFLADDGVQAEAVEPPGVWPTPMPRRAPQLAKARERKSIQ